MKYIAIFSSGTGGHVYPALALSSNYIKKNYKIIWVGTKQGIESKIISNDAIELLFINAQGIRGKSFINKTIGILKIFVSIYESIVILRKYKPKLVFGFGGYVSFAGIISSFILRIPRVIHEQNAIAGTANRINYYFSSEIYETFPSSFRKYNDKIIHTGNIVRDIMNKVSTPDEIYKINELQLRILVIGGSQGSSFLNNSFPFIASHFVKNSISIKHISGKDNKLNLESKYKKYDVDVEVIEYSDNIEQLYDWCNLVICRSGSTTLSELGKIGRASILVPFPFATDNHQLLNANYLAQNSAAIIIEQNESSIENFVLTLNLLLLKNDRLYSLATNIKKIFPDHAIDNITKNSLKLIDRNNEN